MNGYWSLIINWSEEQNEEPIDARFKTIEDAVRVLKKYNGYEEAQISFWVFDDPDRL